MEANEARSRAEAANAAKMGIEADNQSAENQRIAEKVQELVTQQRLAIDKKIEAAADMGESHIVHEYNERIGRSRNTDEEVLQIKLIADNIVSILETGLVQDGFSVTKSQAEMRDIRDNVGAPNEYYRATFFIRW